MQVKTITTFERTEWARMAQDAYRTGRNWYGHRYSAAAGRSGEMPLQVFDGLMFVYRRWLVGGWAEVENPS